ncbi:alcohol dehydrogenase [Nitzschia inconspicua]|uniref:Alcohol dehydrogenase n=1 Tax=Nitzschia inconspicua TaxID=303405 RepID=A0A9K3KAX1_9STRA|nr:alcohol dehydrogenase [Nitzschia inconspicua]KAG7359428.1 alcohol dehydrogenase [Nitzschia inconspicua]
MFRDTQLLSSISFYSLCYATWGLSLSSPPLQEAKAWMVPRGVSFGSLDKLQRLPMETTTTAATCNIAEPSNENTSPQQLVRVSTRAIGLNFADIFCVLGLYQAANKLYGKEDVFVPGLEFSGIVVDDPTGTFHTGQAVLGFTRFGAYSDIVQVPASFLWPLPLEEGVMTTNVSNNYSWSFVEGASFFVQALTAWHGLVDVGGMPDLTVESQTDKRPPPYIVLVHSAAGGVGLWASEIAAKRGAVVIGVVGSREKEEVYQQRILPLSPYSRSIIRGDERTFGRRLQILLQEMSQLSSDPESVGVDMVMESLGGKYFTASYEALRRGGSLVTFGSTSYASPGLGLNPMRLIWMYLNRPKIDPGELTSRNIRLAGFNLIYLTDQPAKLRSELTQCIRCLGGDRDTVWSAGPDLGLVTPPIVGQTFDFRTETIQALVTLKSGKTIGKIVLDNSQNVAT